MKTKKVRLASMVLLTLTLIVVGVMVWPTPKEAMAVNTTFSAWVDWGGISPLPPDPDNLILNVHTYSDQERLLEVPVCEMICSNTQNGISHYYASFQPGTTGIYWSVIATTEYELNEGSVIHDGDTVVFGDNNHLDNTFHVVG